MSVRTFTMLGTGMVTTMLLAQGCHVTEQNPRHCNNNEGDEYCNREFGDGITVLYCEQGTPECRTREYGCVEQRPADECYSPCGGRSTIDENGECLMMEDSSSGSSSEGTDTEPSTGNSESSSTTGPMPCVSDEECTEPEAPFCGTNGECGTCDQTEDGDAACASVDSMLPLCVAGACVACTDGNPVVCEDQLLLCDGTTNTCVQCSEHGQCPSGACELSVGRCFPDDFVVRVDGDEVAMPPELYETVADAVAAVPDGMHVVIRVHELDGLAPYTESVTFGGGKTIALLAAAGEAPIIQGTGGNPGLRVEGAGTILYIEGLRVSQATGRGVEVNQALAWLDRSHIVQNTGGGILAENNAELVVRNCFVGGGGGSSPAAILDNATGSVTYTTLSNTAVAATPALQCLMASSLVLRNSIVVTEGGAVGAEFDCSGADVTYSASEALIAGEGNVATGLFPDGTPEVWFVGLSSGDFHLQNDGLTVFADVAQWTSTDPPTDIDGDSRPTVDGTADYAGADVP